MEVKLISMMDKVFPCDNAEFVAYKGQESVFRNETFAFQIAYKGLAEKKWHKIKASSNNNVKINLFSVGVVPSELPAYKEYDDNYITVKPGLFPDALYPIENGAAFFSQPEFWRSIWVEAVPLEDTKAGSLRIEIEILSANEEKEAAFLVDCNILDYELPKQKLIHTEWFHCDCLSNYYGVEMMSERHWELIEKYINFASLHGVNMILTPVFTPPLDTKVGGERPTMQLVGVKVLADGYKFDFSKLKRWIDMCGRCGIEYFEISHLFTQWGAEHAPKIMAEKDGIMMRIFGWETDSAAEPYSEFLEAFLPQLVAKLKEWEVAERCLFHVSDEPNKDQLESYKKASDIIRPYLEGFKIIDALSNIEFYKTGLVPNPIPASNHIDEFIASDIKGLWTYYCCGQFINVSNRFMSMPSSRNRILGFQLFKYDIEGFLHWGYNFWNSQYSLKAINPYCVTDAGCAFPSGDAFLVYPGENEPVASIRLKVLSKALYDLRALKLLSELTSKQYVLDIIESGLDKELSFSKYPINSDYITSVRKKINDEIAGHIQ